MKALINISGTKNVGIIVLGVMLCLPGCAPSPKKAEVENKSGEQTTAPEIRKLSPAQAYEMIAADSGNGAQKIYLISRIDSIAQVINFSLG